MRLLSLPVLCVLYVTSSLPVQASQWQPEYKTKTYAITGATPIELYNSIGENGPVISGQRRTIALTQWDLKWRRDYQPDGSACVLKSATPILTITFTSPKPKTKLPSDTQLRWQKFIAGIKAHESVHGADIVTMTETIITHTVGLRTENDAQCKTIRAEVLKRVQAAAEAYKAKSQTFEKTEMASGGNIQTLIVQLLGE